MRANTYVCVSTQMSRACIRTVQFDMGTLSVLIRVYVYSCLFLMCTNIYVLCFASILQIFMSVFRSVCDCACSKADGAPFGTVYVMPANALCCCRLPIAISSPLFCRRSSLLRAGVGANTENAEWDCTEAAAAGGCLSTGLFASLKASDFGSLEATDPTDCLVTASAFSFKGML